MANLQQQDAIALLKEDHRKVEDLFKQFEKASGDGRKQKLAQQICLELTVHSIIEEEIFYPAIRGKVEEDLLNESLVEHDSAKLLISEIEAADGADDEFFDSKVKVLREQIEHHIEEEEKGKDSLFGQTREADVDLKRLGEQLSERKKALTKEFKEKGLPAPELSTMTEVEV